MGRKNYNAFLKKQKAEKKRKAKKEKREKRETRKNQPSSGSLEDMMAYIDQNGNIISVEPDNEGSENPEVTDRDVKEPNRNSTQK